MHCITAGYPWIEFDHAEPYHAAIVSPSHYSSQTRRVSGDRALRLCAKTGAYNDNEKFWLRHIIDIARRVEYI